jgi:hypothetical protein
MHQRTDSAGSTSRPALTIRVASRKEVSGLTQWQSAFAQERKDHRYYELLEDTLKDGFTYGYLIVEDDRAVRAVQPYFLVDQDLLAGMSGALTKIVAVLRRLSERFMRARTLMVGCAAGEGHLDGDEAGNFATAEALGRSLPDVARELRCAMIVLKEFPAKYRAPLQCLLHEGFARVPSMPMTTLDIDYKNFEDYLSNCLSPRTRGKVRRKLRAAERAQPTITMSVVGDVTPFIEDVYPLYEKVFERSPLQFEKLTKEFLCENRTADAGQGQVLHLAAGKPYHCVRPLHDARQQHLPRVCGIRLRRRVRAEPILSRIPRHHRMGHREPLQVLLQRQPELRSEVAPATVALPCRSLRAPYLPSAQRGPETGASADGADALRPDSSQLSQLPRALGLSRRAFPAPSEPEQPVPVNTLGGPVPLAGARNDGEFSVQ